MRRTEKIVTAVLVSAIVANLTSTLYVLYQAHRVEEDKVQVKEDVMLLMNDIEKYGDIDTYTGSDHFEHLYEWSHNLK